MKRIRYIGLLWSILSVFLLLEACHPQEQKVLSRQKLSQVMADVYLTESMLKQLDSQTKREWSKGMRNDYFQDISYHWILDKHQISEEDFYASVAHYSRKPKDMIEVLDLTEDHLKAMQHALAEREQREIAAREKEAFDRKWQNVYIDTAFVELWAVALYRQVDSLALNDSLPQTDSLLCSLDTLCTLDTLCALDTAKLALPHDSLLFVVDSLRPPYEEQYYLYWQSDNERRAKIVEATRYLSLDKIGAMSVDTTILDIDTLSPKTDSIQIKKPLMLRDLNKQSGRLNLELATGVIQESLQDTPTKLRADDGRGR